MPVSLDRGHEDYQGMLRGRFGAIGSFYVESHRFHAVLAGDGVSLVGGIVEGLDTR